jgi:hypothetical protein
MLAERIQRRLNILDHLEKIEMDKKYIKGYKQADIEKLLSLKREDVKSYPELCKALLDSPKVYDIAISENNELKEAYASIVPHIDHKFIEQLGDDVVITIFKFLEKTPYRYNNSLNTLAETIITHKLKKPIIQIMLDNMVYLQKQRLITYKESITHELWLFLQHPFVKGYTGNFAELYTRAKDRPDIINLASFLFKLDGRCCNFKIEAISNIDNTEKLLTSLKELQEITGSKTLANVLRAMFTRSFDVKDIFALKTRVRKEDTVALKQLRKVTSPLKYYFELLEFVYGNRFPQLFAVLNKQDLNLTWFEPLAELLMYALRKNKKAFIKLITQEVAVLKELSEQHHNSGDRMPNPVLCHPYLWSRVNLNAVNKKELYQLKDITFNENLEIPDQTITPQEFIYLADAPHFHRRVYPHLKIDRVDDRLRVIKELPASLPWPYQKNMSSPDILKKTAYLISEKPLSKWIQDNIPVKNYSKGKLLTLLIFRDEIGHLIDQVQDEADIEFLLSIKDTLFAQYKDLLEAQRAWYQNNQQLANLLRKMEISKEFTAKYEKNIFRFASRGLIKVVNELSQILNGTQVQNLYLLSKAYMAGQFEKVKFYGDDLDLEIGLKTTEAVKKNWQSDMVKTAKNLVAKETSDFETTLRIGEYPVRTCMNWSGGSYRNCLLANFDANKKILVGYKDNELVGRAIIRLTKGSENPPSDSNKLRFRNIEEIENQEKSLLAGDKKEDLVLFLERPYFKHCSEEEEQKLMTMFIKIILEKARLLGARAVFASSYEEVLVKGNTNCSGKIKKYHIFISYSKNGTQYLDSFNGQNSSKNEGSYVKDRLFVVNP